MKKRKKWLPYHVWLARRTRSITISEVNAENRIDRQEDEREYLKKRIEERHKKTG